MTEPITIVVTPTQTPTISVDPITPGTPSNQTITVSPSYQLVAYTHHQNGVSAEWVIPHNLGFYPNVTVQDSTGTIVEGEITYTNTNTLTVYFSSAFSGYAYLS